MGNAASRALRVALIADQDKQGKRLKELLESSGLDVIVDQAIRDYRPEEVGADMVDVLLVNLVESAGDEMERLEALIENSVVPILFNEGGVPGGGGWGRKLIAKLTGLVQGRMVMQPAARGAASAQPESATANVAAEAEAKLQAVAQRPALRVVAPQAPERSGPAQKVWILGSSLGGPQALKSFLSHLPDNLPVGFIIAQHIGKPFVHLLAEQLDRVTGMRVMPAEHGRTVRVREVILVPVDKRFRVTDAGVVEFHDEPIRGPYRPCIDEVMEDIAASYGKNASAIIFSGMGEDGALGASAITKAGGQVWAQEASSCVISSMPDAARRQGVVTYSGSPEELASHMVSEIGIKSATS